MKINSYKSYIKSFSKTTRVKGKPTKVVDLTEFCRHRNLDFGYRKYCGECGKIYWKWLLRMREGLKRVDKRL